MTFSAASCCTAAIFAAGPTATLPVLTTPVIMVGAMVVGPGPAVAQNFFPFGAPVPRKEPVAPKVEARPTPPASGPEPGPTAAPAAAPPVATPNAPAQAAPVTALPAAPQVTAQAQPSPSPVLGPTTWRVELADVNVRRVIERWSRAAGMQVVYEASKDVDVGAAAAFAGTYEHALQQLLSAIESSEMPLRACLYANAVARVIPRMQRCD